MFIAKKGVKFLLVPELLDLIKQEYGISASKLKPFSSVWRLKSNHCSFLLKRIRNNPHRHSQLAKLINDLHHQGFNSLVPIIPTKTGALNIQTPDNCYYYLSPWVEGVNPNFSDLNQLKIIAECFGELHSLTPTIPFPEEDPQDCLTEYQQKLGFLESTIIRVRQSQHLNRIDQTVLKWSEYFLNQSRYCVSELKKITPDKLQLNKLMGFCHNDPASGNIIIHNRNCFLFDFEFAGFDFLIKEFSLLTLRALQANYWEPRIIELITTSYQTKRVFSEIELKMLPYLLCFPRRFWRFCRQRYQEKLPWTEKRYQNRLWEITSEEKDRQMMIKKYLPI